MQDETAPPSLAEALTQPRNGLVELSPGNIDGCGETFCGPARLKVRKLRSDAKLPTYAHGATQDSGLDLYCAETTEVPRGKRVMVPTGIAVELPPCTEGQIRSRSGLALKMGLRVFQGVGTADPSFRGEIFVMLENAGEHATVIVPVGDRIAQMIVAPYIPVEVEEVAELSDSVRGANGFGSSGK